MCGRFTLQRPSDALTELFEFADGGDLKPRFNIAPTQSVPAWRQSPEDSENEIAWLRWGLIPFFAKDASIGARMINARSETVAEKPSFRTPFKRRRCLIPADGFLEWQRRGKQKLPFHFTMADGGHFAMAGLWEQWRAPTGEVIQSCTVLTTAANELVAEIHDRMPVILKPSDFDLWTDLGVQDRSLLESLLEPFDSQSMKKRPVSQRINNARHDDPECLEDADTAE